MARFNASTYDPTQDSSKGHTKHREDGFDGVVLIRKDDTECPDGCGGKPTGKKRVFRQGHDARLKGILIRAGATGRNIRNVVGSVTTDETPNTVAKRYGFADQVRDGIAKHAAAAKAKDERAADRAKAKEAKATAKSTKAKASTNGGVSKGDRFPIKVGRWTYEGEVTKVSKGVATLEYETKKGLFEIDRPVEELKA